jgi:hypothetical protein
LDLTLLLRGPFFVSNKLKANPHIEEEEEEEEEGRKYSGIIHFHAPWCWYQNGI